jgi:integrase
METKRMIEQALTQLNATICEYNYKPETMRKYGVAISNLSIFLTTYQESGLSGNILEAYEPEIESKHYSKQYQAIQLRIVFLIQGFLETGVIDGAKNNGKPKTSILNQNFRHLFYASIVYLDFGIKITTARVYSQVIRKFCNMLSSEGVIAFSEIDSQTLNTIVQDFTQSCPGSMDQVIRSIRQFLGFLNSKGLCTEFKMDPAVYRVPNRSRTIPCFTKSEVQEMLNCCNQENEMACRIRAIILIAVTTGLRACDIATLKRQDIDWKDSTIAIRQKKTGRRVDLPLLPEVGNAVAKYILCFRGETETQMDEVFLQHTRKTVPIHGGAINSQFWRLCNSAGIEKKEGRGFHGLRRSAATWLSEIDMDPHGISLFLGHSSFSSINKYIATNPKMAKCSLNFEGIPLQSEVYHD